MSQLKEIFKNRSKIWEGLKNNVFKQDHIETIYNERLAICTACKLYDPKGEGCVIGGTQPCCNKNLTIEDVIDGLEKQGCGCSLSLKLRSLSSDCPARKWLAVTTSQDEDMIKQQISKQTN